MNSNNLIHIVSCHAEGEVGNVIVGGIVAPKGDSLWEKARWIDQDQKLRQFVLNEPRGGVFKHVNLLVPAQNPKAQQGQHRGSQVGHFQGHCRSFLQNNKAQ